MVHAACPATCCVLQRRDIPIDEQQIEAIILAEDDAASDVLQAIYAFISSDAYRQVLTLLGGQREPQASLTGGRTHRALCVARLAAMLTQATLRRRLSNPHTGNR